MASTVGSVTDQVMIESGVFGVQDVDTAGTPTPWPQELLEPGDGLLARPNRLDLESSARDLTASVTLESWDGPPPGSGEPADDYDVEEDELTLSSGMIRLWELTGGGSGTTFHVGPPGRYAVRCVTIGQTTAAELEAAGEPVPDGIVEYRLSFWPVTCPTTAPAASPGSGTIRAQTSASR